jgi:hypothetical protein
MKEKEPLMRIVGILSAILFVFSLSVADRVLSADRATESPAVIDTPSATEPSMPIYKPPKVKTPRARVGGSFRGTDGENPEIIPIVPDHVGMTGKQAPELNWFLSKTTSFPLTFTLRDNNPGKPLHEGPLAAPKQPGIHSVSLKDLGLKLEPNVQYWWYVSVVLDPNSPSTTIVGGGVIERCEFIECTTIGFVPSCDRESFALNAERGFWYDAMACLCTLIDTNPTDQSLRRQRASLLRQVGLNGVADWDLRSIQAPIR